MVNSLAGVVVSVGQAFRETDVTGGQQMLPQIVDAVRGALVLTDQCAAALGAPRQVIRCADQTFDRWLERFGERLAVLLEAQSSEDWLTVADSLEYEIAPALAEWAGAFDHLASLARDSGNLQLETCNSQS
jgi:hypothetical protein